MVSSIVPRLEDKCPPVPLTDSIRKLRSSSASCGNCARSSLRRSSGKLVVLSNGYISGIPELKSKGGRSGSACVVGASAPYNHGVLLAGAARHGGRSPPYKGVSSWNFSSEFSQYDKVGKFAQALRGIAEPGQAFQRLAMQPLRHVARALNAQQADIGRLAVIRVLARSLAQRGGVRFAIQHVVHHLKGQSDQFAETIQPVHLRGFQAGTTICPQQDRRADQRAEIGRA